MTILIAFHLKSYRNSKHFYHWLYSWRWSDWVRVLEYHLLMRHRWGFVTLKDSSFLNNIFGKLFADKGYIGQKLFEQLSLDGIQLISGLKRNMNNCLMSVNDKILLRKRSIIETINDELKNICQVEHSRHRSFGNFLTNLISGLLAYSFLPKKTAIKYDVEPTLGQLALF